MPINLSGAKQGSNDSDAINGISYFENVNFSLILMVA